ncbi:hypothetical protein AVEN_32102-1 [Araneus ventricosus]|uniref:Pre-C2HC domain-containing protein n=1 Tax=Araneus ventricosus TaxID=182803 RepID=A0A4Y2GGS0_ARAVE|nr:hypothetical protein AVEN_32102-1 [Araneus ventricosus]
MYQNPVLDRNSPKDIRKKTNKKTLKEFTPPIPKIEALNFEVTRIIQFKNFKEQSLHPVLQVDIKRAPQAQTIFNVTHLCHFKIPVESPRRRSIATNVQNSTIQQRIVNTTLDVSNAGRTTPPDCNIQEKLPNSACMNCNSTGHTAAWKVCPTFPKFNTKQVNLSYAKYYKEKYPT